MVTRGNTIDLTTAKAPEQRRPTKPPRPAPRVLHRTPTEHAAAGEEARRQVPHGAHSEFDASSARRDPIALLESQAPSRVPELVPIRYGRMLVSPFAFYRGAALVRAHDVPGTRTRGITTQVWGDAQLSTSVYF